MRIYLNGREQYFLSRLLNEYKEELNIFRKDHKGMMTYSQFTDMNAVESLLKKITAIKAYEYCE